MNRTEFAANEISRETQSGGISAGYATMMSEAKTMSKPEQAALTQDLVKNGTLPKLSLAFLQDDMTSHGSSYIDKQGVDDLKNSAEKSGNPLQAAMANDVDHNFNAEAETRRIPVGRYGEMKTAIFADTLASGLQTSEGGAASPPEKNGAPATSGDHSTGKTPAAGKPDVDEQVKSGDSYWSVAERALGISNTKPLDKEQDRQVYGLMRTLQNENGNAMLQPGDTVSVQASDINKFATERPAPAAPEHPAPAAPEHPAPVAPEYQGFRR